MAYVRYFYENNVLEEQMLFSENLFNERDAMSIFISVKSDFYIKVISLTNIVAYSTGN